MALFGQPNATYTFAVGQKTNIDDEDHRIAITNRFDEYYGDILQEEWQDFLGDSANRDVSRPDFVPKITFNSALYFFTLLRVKYRIKDLGVGLLSIQLINLLAEIGLVQQGRLETIADFVGTSGKLGAVGGSDNCSEPLTSGSVE